MTAYYANEQINRAATIPVPVGNEALGGRLRTYRATIPLDAPKLTPTSAGSGITTSDTVSLAKIPPGMRFMFGVVTSSVSLSTSTIAVGTSASTGKYRAAAVFTATDTPTLFGTAASVSASAYTAEEEVILTTATANLPTTAGAVLVIDLVFAGP